MTEHKAWIPSACVPTDLFDIFVSDKRMLFVHDDGNRSISDIQNVNLKVEKFVLTSVSAFR